MNFFRFRSELFHSLVGRYVPEACVLPWWARGLRTLLFPREMLGHFLSRPNHYDMFTDTYLIHGVRYAGALFRAFAAPDEQGLYRFKRMGEVVTIERVTPPVPQQEAER
jgi:hypothetical protein